MRWRLMIGFGLAIWLCLGVASSAPTAIPARVGLQVPQTATATYAGPPLAIPDAAPNGVSIPLSMTSLDGAIRDVDFLLGGSNCAAIQRASGITHSWVGDLRLDLHAPEGQIVTLIDRPGSGSRGSSGDDFCQTWLDDDAATAIDSITAVGSPPLGPPHTGVFKPQQPLALFDGQPSQGNWTVVVRDLAPLDVGSIQDFSLIVEALAFTPTASLTVDETVGTIVVAVELAAISAETITIPYSISGTADGQDHSFEAGSVTFTSGKTLAVIEGRIFDNAPEPEPTETLIITLEPAMGVTLTDPSSITIRLLDGVPNTAPTLTLTGTVGVEQGRSALPRPIGTVSDAESTPDSLDVTWPALPNGLDVQIENHAGRVVAKAAATCDVAEGNYPLPVTITDTGGLTVTQDVLLRVFAPSGPCGPNGLLMDLTPPLAIGAPTQVLTYSLALTNASPYSSSFTLVVTNTLWIASNAQFTLDLAQGASTHVSIPVSIPSDAQIPSLNQTAVSVTATIDQRVKRTLSVTTKAWIERGRLLIPFLGR